MKTKVLKNFRYKLVLVVVLDAKCISGVRLAIRVILGELLAIDVVNTTSAGSSICPVDKYS